MALDDPTTTIRAFLAEIGIPVTAAPLDRDGFLPGIAVRDGGLTIDPARRFWPGDLLHEAGHIAVTAPEARATLTQVSDCPGEEMAAIAWSYAAARAIGIDPAVVFHEAGYRGGSAALLENFNAGRYFGVPLLACWGMTIAPGTGPDDGSAPCYPAMQRWLR